MGAGYHLERIWLIPSVSSKQLKLVVFFIPMHNDRLNFAFSPTHSLYSKTNSEQSGFSDDNVRSMDTFG